MAPITLAPLFPFPRAFALRLVVSVGKLSSISVRARSVLRELKAHVASCGNQKLEVGLVTGACNSLVKLLLRLHQ